MILSQNLINLFMRNIQIVVPMSGFGNRFKTQGYKTPKPLLKINGIPIIAHIINMFPGESNFLFICNNDHLKNKIFRMQEILNYYCPNGKIFGIEKHKKGPVHAIMEAKSYINKNSSIIVNYCDFNCYWSWNDFKRKVFKIYTKN